jgi:hypothetical protein
MTSSSVGICDRGDGIAPGGRGRQRVRMSGVDGARSDVGCATFEEDGVLLIGVCNPLVESLGGNMAEVLKKGGAGPVSLRLTRKPLPTPLVFLIPFPETVPSFAIRRYIRISYSARGLIVLLY